jgi:hypothetical protein
MGFSDHDFSAGSPDRPVLGEWQIERREPASRKVEQTEPAGSALGIRANRPAGGQEGIGRHPELPLRLAELRLPGTDVGRRPIRLATVEVPPQPDRSETKYSRPSGAHSG